MKTETYNGWTNYATWRVNLEFNLIDLVQDLADEELIETDGIAEYIQDYVEECICSTSTDLAQDYALAFLDDVNWYEIAESISEDLITERNN